MSGLRLPGKRFGKNVGKKSAYPVVAVSGEDKSKKEHIEHNADTSLGEERQHREAVILKSEISQDVQKRLPQKEEAAAEGQGRSQGLADFSYPREKAEIISAYKAQEKEPGDPAVLEN